MERTRRFGVLLLSLLLVGLLCACQSAEQGEESAASDQPSLTIGVDMLKPFFYLDENGAYAGIDAEIATEVCRRAGYTPVFVNIPWSERDEYLEDGTVDCLWTAFIQNDREDAYLWTETYLDSQLAALVDERCPDKSIQEFRSKVAVRAGSMSEELFRDNENPEIGIYSCGTFNMAETAFIKGYAGALAGHKIVLQQLLDENGEKYRFLSDEIMEVQLGVAFDKQDTTGRCQAISDSIHAMKQDGTLDTLAQKYGLTGADQEGGDANAADEDQ